MAAIAALVSCGSATTETRRLETFDIADDDVTVLATVLVTQCDNVLDLVFDIGAAEVTVAARVEVDSGDCDAMGVVVEMSGVLPEPLGGRSLVTGPIRADD